MDADGVGDEAGGEHNGECSANVGLLHGLALQRAPGHPGEYRAKEDGDAGDKADAGEKDPDGYERRAGTREGDGEGKEDPGGHVIDGSGGHGHAADVGGEELKLSEDAGEDGEGSDGESDAHEDEEGALASALDDGVSEDDGGADAEDEGEGDACDGDSQGPFAGATDGSKVELEADQEEEEKEADVGQRVEHRHALLGEHIVREPLAAAKR